VRASALILAAALGATGLPCSAAPAAATKSEPSSNVSPRVAFGLVWIYGDDDALHAPSETRPVSPAASVGDREGYDGVASGLSSRYSGRESAFELGLHAAAPGFVPRLSTSAELALRFELGSLGGKAEPPLVEDLGSSLAARLSLDGRSAPELELRLYPFHADHERVGWLEALAWGGTVGRTRESIYGRALDGVRGATLSMISRSLRLSLGVKTASFLESAPLGPPTAETSYGGFLVASARVAQYAYFGLGAGRFEHGRLEGTAEPPRAVTLGASARAGFAVGYSEALAPASFGADLPASASSASVPRGFALGVEAVTLVQRLSDFDASGRTVLAPAHGAALIGSLAFAHVELRAALVVRAPEFVLRHVPGVLPGQTLPRSAKTANDVLGVVGASYRGLPVIIPSLALGVRSPAAVMTGGLNALGEPAGSVLVLYAPNDVEFLPPGQPPVPALETRAGLDARLSSLFSALAWVEYRRDFNRTRLAPGPPSGALGRAFLPPDRLGYGLAARAVW
jgi:hypothetical protein